MTILIAGGTGFIGSYLRKRFTDTGFDVHDISRSKGGVSWHLDDLVAAFEKADVLINLAGKSINTRFTEKNKKEILQSRINTTTLLNEAVARCIHPPKLWINASAAGIYRHTFEDKRLDELSGEYAGDFLGNVVRQWENTFFKSQFPLVRKIALRTTVVLGKQGGAFPRFNLLTALGLGGKQGLGKQMISWIHQEDYFRILLFLIANESISGIVNAAAPNPVTNASFMKELRSSKKALIGIPAPVRLLKIASFFIGVDDSLLLDSTNVDSKILNNRGFEFRFPTIDRAFEELTKK